MKGRKRAELKNDILKFLVKDGRRFDTDWLFIILNRPVKSDKYFKKIVIEMCKEANAYFNSFEEGLWLFISSNNSTQDFLDRGGFIQRYSLRAKADREMQRLV